MTRGARTSRPLFFYPVLFLFFICLSPSFAYSGDDFYTLAKQWEKKRSFKTGSQGIVKPGAGVTPVVNDLSQAGPSPLPISLTRSIDELTGTQPIITIEQHQSLFVKFTQSIVKFISTEEKVLFEKIGTDTLRIEGDAIGVTFIHVWTSDGERHTFQVQVIPEKFLPSAAQVSQQEAFEKSRTFKIGYTANRDTFYSADRFRDKSRGSLDFTQYVSLEGDSPYGAVASHASIQKSRAKNLLTDAQLSLKDAQIGPVKDFNAAVGDSRVSPGLMAFPGARIRGAVLEHWWDNKRFSWISFYGRELNSIIGTLTPGVTAKNTLNSYLRGGAMSVKVNDNAKIKGGYFVGSGRSRADGLPKRTDGLSGDFDFGRHLSFNPEVGYDSEHFAQKDSVILKFDKLRLKGELRNISKKFESLIGAGGAQGEMGYLFQGNSTLWNDVVLTGSTDIFRDRLISNPEDLQAFNVHTDLSLNLSPWQGSNLLLSYQSVDDTGRLGPNRQTTYNANFNQRIEFLGHRGNIFARYQDRESVVLNNSISDYRVNQVSFGYSTQLFWDINFSISQQMNFLNEYNLPAESTPRVLEYNLDYSNRIGDTPFFTDLRLRIRDEENTESVNSSMSGFDTTEVSASFFYREFSNMEIYVTSSFQNYKQESLNVTEPRIELRVLTGIRYLFDTQFQWSAVGSFDGTVFKDLNGDGKRQPDEPGIEGMVVRTTGKREAVTDKKGHYDLKSISGKGVTLSLDTSNLPYGYVPTTSARQELTIVQGKKQHIDFGITPRSEVTGIIYNDLNLDGKYDVGVDKGVGKVRILMENGATTRSNILGVYSFPDLVAGNHTASIDFSKLPQGYLPEGIPRQSFTLFEGIRYELNFPLKAVRSLTGRVYIDANGNHRVDADEKGVVGVKILIGAQSAVTDKEGWYLFNDLPSGDYELSVDKITLPRGYLKPHSVKINLPTEPVTLTNADLELHK